MVMFIPCRLKIINRLFSRVCFYFHLCPVITVESHSGRPSPKKTKSHLTFHKHQPNFTSQKIEQKQPKILPSSTCSAVPICQKFWFNQPTQQSQHQTSPALKQKSPTSRGVTFSQWRIINPTVTTSIDKPNQTNQKIPGQDFSFQHPKKFFQRKRSCWPKKTAKWVTFAKNQLQLLPKWQPTQNQLPTALSSKFNQLFQPSDAAAPNCSKVFWVRKCDRCAEPRNLDERVDGPLDGPTKMA